MHCVSAYNTHSLSVSLTVSEIQRFVFFAAMNEKVLLIEVGIKSTDGHAFPAEILFTQIKFTHIVQIKLSPLPYLQVGSDISSHAI